MCRREKDKIISLGQTNSIVGGNIIATTKIRNNYGAIQSIIFPILRQQYWTFLYCSLLSYHPYSFLVSVLCFFFDSPLSKVIALPTIAM